MNTSSTRVLALAVCGAGLGVPNAAVGQPAAPGATTERSPTAASFEPQQALNNTIQRIAPGGVDRSKRSPQQVAAQLVAQRKDWEPTPPPADPRDLTGPWAMIDAHIDLVQDDGNQAPFTAAEAEATRTLMKAEEAGNVVTDASTQCFPHGVPRLTIAPGYPIRFVYLPGTILMLHEVAHNVRIIHMDQQAAPKDAPATFLGYSVGHWEGNTLVVTTSHFNDKTRLDSVTSHGPKLKVIERFTREKTPQEHTDLAVRITIDDPDHFYKVFSISRKLGFRSDLARTVWADGIMEYSCEENNRNVPTVEGIVTAK